MAYGPVQPPLQPGTLATFAHKVLDGLGAPATDENVSFLLAWFAREGTKAAYNPLATTLNYGSNTKFNSVGVRNYADEATGVAATVKTLQGYPGIVSDLKVGNTHGAAYNHPAEFSKWSGGGYTSIAWGGVGDTVGGNAATPGGAGGGSGGASSPAGLAPNASPAEVEGYIRSNYPEMAGFLNIPEIRTILIDEAQKKGTIGELEARIYATSWWKTNGANARQYFETASIDPATHEELVKAKIAELAPEVAKLGLDMDVRVYAENALKFGWTPQQTAADEATRLRMQSAAAGLKAGSAPAATADQLAAIATNEYYVPMNRQDTEAWAINIGEGRSTEAQFRDYLSGMANSRFPGLKGQGITPGQYMSPIVNTIAKELELQPGDVNLLDPKFSPVLQTVDSTGLSRPMTISEAQNWARQQPGYLYTNGARDQASQFADVLGKTFGAFA